MPLVVKDRVLETSTTTGTGTLTLAGASTGYQTFSSAIGNTNTTYYAIVGGSEWEVGLGTVGAGTLSRNTILESSNGGTAVNFSAGTKLVFCTYPAERSVDTEIPQTLSNKTLSSPSVTGNITFGDSSTQSTAPSGFGFKNRIINGAMMIDQRNAGASVTPTDTQYTLDRWVFGVSAASKFTAQQNAGSVTPPAGFRNYIGITSSSAYSVVAGDYFNLNQPIEGFNVADLGWGTANAQAVTLSFWVRSSLTGTFGGSLRNNNGTRSYPYSYTISAANTWEYKTVTIAGDTTGNWEITSGIGLRVSFGFGVGSTFSGTAGVWASSNYTAPTGATSVVGTNGATFYITGVQLEKGSTATSFDYRPYTTELQLCQRYCYVMTGYAYQRFAVAGWTQNATTAYVNAILPVSTRSPAAISVTTSAMSGFKLASGTTGIVPTAIALDVSALNIITLLVTFSGGGTTGAVANLYSDNSASATITISSEL